MKPIGNIRTIVLLKGEYYKTQILEDSIHKSTLRGTKDESINPIAMGD